MICPKCGSQMDDTDRWCMRCGMINYNAKQSSIIEDQKVESLDFNDNDSSNVASEVSNINYDDVSYSSSSRVSKILFYVVNGIIFLINVISFILITIFVRSDRFYKFIYEDYFAFYITISVTTILISLLYSISYQRIFEKAGKHWWQTFIPIYNVYLIFKICTGDGKLFWNVIVIEIVLVFLSLILPFFMIVFLIIEGILSFTVIIALLIGLADRFNTSRLLMVLFAPIMLPIVALSKSYTYES